jgi:choline dehydrogenase-like flavoprotein
MMGRFSKLSLCAVLPRDASEGRVRIGKDGNPRVDYRLNAADERRIAEGVIQAARVLEAAGAREIYSMHPGWLSYFPDRPGDFERWADETRRRGYRDGRVTFFSYHQMGSCRMGVDPSGSAVGPNNESHEVAGLYVLDGSCFPTASGVNPMLSIYGIAHRGAKLLAERLA